MARNSLDQVGLELIEICLPSSGIKDVKHNAQLGSLLGTGSMNGMHIEAPKIDFFLDSNKNLDAKVKY